MKVAMLNPLAIAAGLARHRYLLGQLVKRDVRLRYRGAMFGVAWIFLRSCRQSHSQPEKIARNFSS